MDRAPAFPGGIPGWDPHRRLPGVDYVGPIPEELQTKISFAAGLSTSAKDSDRAKALVRVLLAPEAKAILRAKGVELP